MLCGIEMAERVGYLWRAFSDALSVDDSPPRPNKVLLDLEEDFWFVFGSNGNF